MPAEPALATAPRRTLAGVVAVLTVLTAVVVIAAAPPAAARPRRGGAELDPSFGTGGVSTPHRPDGVEVAGVDRQPRTRSMVVAGWRADEVVLARIAADGSLDPAFGTEGVTATPLAGLVGDAWGDPVADVAVLPDGRVLVLATAANRDDLGDPCLHAAVLARYTPDGELDASFGEGGMVVDDWGCDAHVRALAVQPDGRVLTAGFGIGDPGFGAFVARHHPDGSRDASFGDGGVANLHWVQESPPEVEWVGEQAAALAVQPDGRVVVGGTRLLGPTDDDHAERSDLLLARLTADGRPDPTFGDGGAVIADLGGGDEEVRALGLTPSGAVVAAGVTDAGLVVLRTTPAGTLDATFSDDGIVVRPWAEGGHSGEDVAVDARGRVVAAGTACPAATRCGPGDEGEYALVRLTPKGSPDAGFGTGGAVRGPTGDLAAVVLRPDGRAVAAGDAAGRVRLARWTGCGGTSAPSGRAV